MTEPSPYAPGMDELTIEGEIAKVDDEQRQVFGWASVTEINGEPVVDLQNDVLETYELEKAAYDYVLNSRVGGEMHQRVKKDAPKQVGTLIESMVITPEKIEKMGLPPETPRGWWIGFQVAKDETGNEVWKAVKDKKYTGFSIHGLGKRLEKNYDEIGKGVAQRSPEEIKAWILRMSETAGVEPEKLAKDLLKWLEQQGGKEPTDDDLHEFITRTYGSGNVMAKHLLGSHDQEDHDPTEHSRRDHSTAEGAKAGAKAGGAVGVAGGAVQGGLWGGPGGAAMGAASGGAFLGTLGAIVGGFSGARSGGKQAERRAQTEASAFADVDPDNLRGVDFTDPAQTEMALYEAESRKVGKSMSTELFLLAKAAERAHDQAEFLDNTEEIGKALSSAAPEKAQFFDDFNLVAKHLIGNHDQEDHDPTNKKGEGQSKPPGHSRESHTGGDRAKSGGKLGAALAAAGLGAAMLTPGGRAAARMFGQKGAQAARYGGRSAQNTVRNAPGMAQQASAALGRGGQAARQGASDVYGGIARGGLPQAERNIANFATSNPTAGQAFSYGAGIGAPYGAATGLAALGVDNMAQGMSPKYDAYARRQRDARRQRKLSKREMEVLSKYLGPVAKYIEEEDGKYVVYSESGKKLGEHETREKAQRQLAAVEANKGS